MNYIEIKSGWIRGLIWWWWFSSNQSIKSDHHKLLEGQWKKKTKKKNKLADIQFIFLSLPLFFFPPDWNRHTHRNKIVTLFFSICLWLDIIILYLLVPTKHQNLSIIIIIIMFKSTSNIHTTYKYGPNEKKTTNCCYLIVVFCCCCFFCWFHRITIKQIKLIYMIYNQSTFKIYFQIHL